MLLFLLLLFAVECNGKNNPLPQGVPLSTLNFMRSRVKFNIKFNQASLDRVVSHIFLLNDSSGKIADAIKGFIKYGNENNFVTGTIVGDIEEIVGLASHPFDFMSNQNCGDPDNQKPHFTNEYPLDAKLKIVLDPLLFQLPDGTDVSVVISNNYTKIEPTPAMTALVKQMIKKENSINK